MLIPVGSRMREHTSGHHLCFHYALGALEGEQAKDVILWLIN